MGTTSRTVIFTALTAEAKAIGELAGVAVHVIGLGARRIPEIPPASRVIVAGLGGALSPTLHLGDLVLDTPVPGLPTNLPWHIGRIHTARDVVSTPDAKASLFRCTGALAVDMEQAIIRDALPGGIELIGLRAISDPADMAVDPAVLHFVDNFGRPRPLAIGATLLRRPGLVPHLRLLNANARFALRNLGLGAAALVGQLAQGGPVAYAPAFGQKPSP